MDLDEGVMVLSDALEDIEGIENVQPTREGYWKAVHSYLTEDGKRVPIDCVGILGLSKD